MTVYGHFVEGAQDVAWALGIRGRWVSVDQIGDPRYAAEVLDWCRRGEDARFVLFIHVNEDRARNRYHAWTNMVTPIRWLTEHGLLEQCAAVQIDDELWSRLPAFGQHPHAASWPSMAGWSPDRCWRERHVLADLLAARMTDLRGYWQHETGRACPPIGMAESGGVAPPQTPTQDWWGLNIYLQPGNPSYLQSPEAVWDIYRQAWAFTSLPIMPVIPTFGERGVPPPSIVTLGQTYAAPFRLHGQHYPAIIDHPQTWAVGLFLVRHPGEDDPAHGVGRGLTRLDASYSDGVRWLTAHLRGR